MKGILCALALLVLPAVARADILVVTHDSLAVIAAADNDNLQPFINLLHRSVKPGVRINLTNADGWTLAELRDSVHADQGQYSQYKASLIVVVNSRAFENNPTKLGRLALPLLSKPVNRPRVPVLYLMIGNTADSFENAGNCSLGVTGAPITLTSPFVGTPAGYAYPRGTYFYKKGAGGAFPAMGDYVTPVEWLEWYTYTKSDPDGVGGIASPNDTLSSWFYNPPTLASRAALGANTAGYGCVNIEPMTNMSGSTNAPSAPAAAVAVGMAARLAPDDFAFPGVRVALDVDDGCKRYIGGGGQGSSVQVDDYLAGLDSLGVHRIPYALGIEIDSMDTVDFNGRTRFQNEFAAARKYGMGRVTVHCHAGITSGGGAAGQSADSSLASVSGGVHTDIFGAIASRYAFGTSAATRNKSVNGLLNSATTRLIDAAGDPRLVTNHVMPPTDNHKTALAGNSGGNAATYDSVYYAIALAGPKGWGGYRVVRVQYGGDNHNYNMGGGTGGMPHGKLYPLPDYQSVADANGITGARLPRVILAGSGYLAAPADTTTSSAYGAMQGNVNFHLNAAFGYGRTHNQTQAQDAASSNLLASRGTARETIYVTHTANWQQGIGITSTTYGGGRVGWESVRCIHAAMMAARWASSQSKGPVEWVWPDEITVRDIR